MKKIFVICASIAFIMFVIPGCSKKKGCMDSTSNNYDSDAEEDDGSCTYTAGTGGEVTVVAFPKHHGVEIGGADTLHPDSAFVKFNTSDFPGTSASSYDLVIPGEPGENHVHIEGLKRGKYYIYMTGWDPNATPNRVTGGIPYEVTVTSGEIDVDVPVTE